MKINPTPLTYLFNDGLGVDSNNQSICTNNGATQWSYNQGVILGGLIELFKITNSTVYIENALHIHDAVKSDLVLQPSGTILHELESSNDVRNSDDQSQFKGIYMRYLGYLLDGMKNDAALKKEYWSFSSFARSERELRS